MIAMLDTSQDLDQCAKEIGCEVEQLFTPLTRYLPQKPDQKFAIDNGAYSNFNPKGFLSLLAREQSRRGLCRFVAVPDVVGSARRTIEVFEHWESALREWPLALVCQDGQENLPIPWHSIAALFIGGTTDWKMGPHASACIKAGKAIGKWVHVGRVNTPGRFEYFKDLGADSIDGTGISRYSHMREKIYRERLIPELFKDA
jgi:hypothetical protein